jgi:hypothetical protein
MMCDLCGTRLATAFYKGLIMFNSQMKTCLYGRCKEHDRSAPVGIEYQKITEDEFMVLSVLLE